MNFLLTAANEATKPDIPLSEAMPELLGFAIVVLVLIALWLLTLINAKISALINATEPPAAAPATAPVPAPAQAVSSPQAQSGDITEEEIVVITATVSALLGDQSHRIVSMYQSTSNWGIEGRRRHFASHKIR